MILRKYFFIVFIALIFIIGCENEYYANNCGVNDIGVRDAEANLLDNIGYEEYSKALSVLCDWLIFGNQYHMTLEKLLDLGVKNPNALRIFVIRASCIECEFGMEVE